MTSGAKAQIDTHIVKMTHTSARSSGTGRSLCSSGLRSGVVAHGIAKLKEHGPPWNDRRTPADQHFTWAHVSCCQTETFWREPGR